MATVYNVVLHAEHFQEVLPSDVQQRSEVDALDRGLSPVEDEAHVAEDLMAGQRLDFELVLLQVYLDFALVEIV